MAKKARREPDPDLEDEEMELDAPPPRKSSTRGDKPAKTSATGKRRSADSAPPPSKDSASRKGLKDSGKRKSTSASGPAASGRRPSSADDGELSGSARRRRAAPPKKKDSTAVIGVSILSITFILVIGIVVINKSKTPTVNNNDEQAQFETFKTMKAEGLKAFGEFNRAEREGNAGVSRAKHSEAHTKLVKAMDILTKILDNHRDPATGFTHKDFEGYEVEQSEIAEVLVDLEKRGDVNSSAGHGGGPSHDNSSPDDDPGGSPDPIPSSGGSDAGSSRTR